MEPGGAGRSFGAEFQALVLGCNIAIAVQQSPSAAVRGVVTGLHDQSEPRRAEVTGPPLHWFRRNESAGYAAGI